jgi:hypothetical protein
MPSFFSRRFISCKLTDVSARLLETNPKADSLLEKPFEMDQLDQAFEKFLP